MSVHILDYDAMARPLSEEKREAILTAATELVARLGTAASTAKIADAAGLGEGTLFTYFPTKDDLLNELLLDIETSLAEALLAHKAIGTPRQRVQRVWDCLVEWGTGHPLQRKAMRQLRVSDRISAENRRRCHALFRETRETIEHSLAGRIDPDRAAFYIDTVLMGLADTVIEAIASNPKSHQQFKQAGFDLFWKGVAA